VIVPALTEAADALKFGAPFYSAGIKASKTTLSFSALKNSDSHLFFDTNQKIHFEPACRNGVCSITILSLLSELHGRKTVPSPVAVTSGHPRPLYLRVFLKSLANRFAAK